MTKTIKLTDEQIADLCPAKPALSDVVMIRSGQAGVFFGNLVGRAGDEVTLTNARRCWKWAGAATLSDLATVGTARPSECKFSAPTAGEHIVLGSVEIMARIVQKHGV